MRIQTKKMAGMVMCILGILATSSCSKEDFFGLNEYETLDYSKKTEIALSQEYTDYYIACIEVGKVINQWSDSIDATKGVPNNYTGESLVKLLDKLKEAFPELSNADIPDFADIRKIALSKNKTLNALVSPKKPSAKTKSYEYTAYYPDGTSEPVWYNSDAEACISYLNYIRGGSPWSSGWYSDNEGYLYSCAGLEEAVCCVLFSTSEYGYYYNTINCGGLVFSQGAIAVISRGENWPSMLSYIPVAPEKSFHFLDHTPTQIERYAIQQYLGYGMEHILLDFNGEVL